MCIKDHAINCINRGNEHRYQGKMESAVMEYSKAIRILENRKIQGNLRDIKALQLVYESRGNIFHHQKKYDRAISDYLIMIIHGEENV